MPSRWPRRRVAFDQRRSRLLLEDAAASVFFLASRGQVMPGSWICCFAMQFTRMASCWLPHGSGRTELIACA
ncbi:unnamed protein product [Urochloa humidicola]